MATTEKQQPPVEADTPVLTAKLGPRWALGPMHVVLVAAWVVFYLILNYLPLRGTDLWGHVVYGQWILEHKQLPLEDPLAPLAEGMPIVDTAWLSQVLFAWVEQVGGAEWLSNLFALTVLATYLLFHWTFYLLTRRPLLAAAGTAIALLVGWSRLTTIRPENFATLLFAVLLWLVATGDGWVLNRDGTRAAPRPWRLWLGVPVVMVLWANMHGSFPCGLAVLACVWLGRVIEVAWQSRSGVSVLADRTMQRWLYLTQWGLAATLLNPYGMDLLLDIGWFSSNENLRDVLEWQPLVIWGVGGREFALSWVALLLVMRHSRQPVPPAHALLIGVFSLAAVFGIRMLTWYAPVYALVVMPHLSNIVSRLWPATRPGRTAGAESAMGSHAPAAAGAAAPGRSWKFSLVCLLLVWIGFALSGVSRPILGGNARSPERMFGAATPVALTDYLNENPIDGLIFNPQWWGDWLVYSATRGDEGDPISKRIPFITTNIHLTPRQVWQDYKRIAFGQAGWQRVLDRYHVEAVVVDREKQALLEPLLTQSRDWFRRYEDDQAVLFTRSRGDREREGESPPDAGQTAEVGRP